MAGELLVMKVSKKIKMSFRKVRKNGCKVSKISYFDLNMLKTVLYG